MFNVFATALILWQVVATPVAPGQQLEAVTVDREEAYQHLKLPDGPFLRILPPQPDVRLLFYPIKVSVVVDITGRVVSATASREWNYDIAPPQGAFEKAESLVQELRYRPFERGGHPVAAKLDQYVQLLPPELEPLEPVPPFPRVKDWQSLKIALDRTECYGWCPSYHIEVRGDGTVWYEGRNFVACKGFYRATVPRENVREMVKMFEQARFFALRDKYLMDKTGDAPTTTISIEFDAQRMEVRESFGLQMGMPSAVAGLEHAVDLLSGSEQWTGRPFEKFVHCPAGELGAKN
jgi:hypothetical protein